MLNDRTSSNRIAMMGSRIAMKSLAMVVAVAVVMMAEQQIVMGNESEPVEVSRMSWMICPSKDDGKELASLLP